MEESTIPLQPRFLPSMVYTNTPFHTNPPVPAPTHALQRRSNQIFCVPLYTYASNTYISSISLLYLLLRPNCPLISVPSLLFASYYSVPGSTPRPLLFYFNTSPRYLPSIPHLPRPLNTSPDTSPPSKSPKNPPTHTLKPSTAFHTLISHH